MTFYSRNIFRTDLVARNLVALIFLGILQVLNVATAPNSLAASWNPGSISADGTGNQFLSASFISNVV
jgi:hypothetical protein